MVDPDVVDRRIREIGRRLAALRTLHERGRAEDYGSAFGLLADVGVLPADLADRLRLAAGLRNVLVHAYLDIDPDRLWAHLGHLVDLDEFARRVVDHLDGR